MMDYMLVEREVVDLKLTAEVLFKVSFVDIFEAGSKE
jgi:hypothetical protein